MGARAMKKRTRRVGEHGFSMVELLTVVAIALILAAIAVPNLLSYMRFYRLRGASQELQAELMRARQQAVMKNVKQGVLFLVEDDRHYRVVLEDSQDPTTRGMPISVSGAIGNPDVASDDDRAQVLPRRELPADILFSSNTTDCPALDTLVHPAIRFGHLGNAGPVDGFGAYPLVDTGTALIRDDDAGTFALCLEDQRYGLTRQLSVTTGGRVRIDNNY